MLTHKKGEKKLNPTPYVQDEAVNEISIASLYQELRNLKLLLTNLTKPGGKRIFNNKTLSEYMDVSTRTLQNWRDAGMISFTQIKDVIFYTEDDVEAFLKKHKRVAFK